MSQLGIFVKYLLLFFYFIAFYLQKIQTLSFLCSMWIRDVSFHFRKLTYIFLKTVNETRWKLLPRISVSHHLYVTDWVFGFLPKSIFIYYYMGGECIRNVFMSEENITNEWGKRAGAWYFMQEWKLSVYTSKPCNNIFIPRTCSNYRLKT